MKKIVLSAAAVLLIALVSLNAFISKNQKDNGIDNMIVSEAEEKFDANTRVEKEDLLTSLNFKGEELPYDDDSKTFYLPLSMSNEEWEEGELTAENEGMSIDFLDDFSKVDKLDAMASNTSFQFVAYTDEEYCYYNLVISGLPIMNIEITDEYIENASIVNMSLYESETKIDWVTNSSATVAVRGGTSKNYPKLSFKMELFKYDNLGNVINNKVELLNMRKDNDWILYAMYNDDTKIRDKLSIDIWNDFGAQDNIFGAEFGTKLEYVELIINNDFYGIYGLMEPIDTKKVKIEDTTDKNYQEYLYKRSINQGLTLDDFMEDSDTILRCGFELKGLSKYGDISLESWNPLINFIQVQNEEDDTIYSEKISDVIDVDSALNTWLFLQMVSGHDNKKKNMYYVSKMTNEGSKLYFIPWDLDLTWGNVYMEGSDLFSTFDSSIVTKEVNWETGQRLIDTNTDNSVEIVNQKWESLRNTIITNDELMNRMDELENVVINSGAMERESIRWPDGGHTTDFSNLEQYAMDRMEYLDTNFDDLLQNSNESN